MSKDGSQDQGSSASLEEASDWVQGFFTFLFGLVSPFDSLEDEEGGAAAEEEGGARETEGVQGQKTCVIVGLHNQ